MTRLMLTTALVASLPSSALAQTAVERAIAAGNAVGDVEDLMEEGTIDTFVVPYETSTPSEGDLGHAEFEDEIEEVRELDDSQGRALRATEDSYEVRPDADVDPQSALFDDANFAHENAEDIAGDYFTSDTGQCETTALPVSEIFDQFCEATPADVSETCDLVRDVWVDRWDTYRCDKRAANYVEVCTRTNEYACHQENGQSGCLQENVRFTGGNVVWNGDEATVSFAAPNAPRSRIARHTFSISVSDRFAPDEIRLTHIEAGGVSQLTKGVLGTASFEVIQTFYDGFGNGLGQGPICPPDDRSGIILPTHFQAYCRGYNYWAVGIYADALQTGSDPESRIFQEWISDYVLQGDGGYEIECFVNTDDPPACAKFQDMDTSANLSRTLLRWIDVPAPTHPVPGAPKVWAGTDLTLRVVSQPGDQHASLTFKFTGTCCDDFINVGVEQCE